MQSTSTGVTTATNAGAPPTQGRTIATNRLARAALTAAIVAAIANLLVYFLVPAIFPIVLEVPIGGPNAPLQPLPALAVALMSALPAFIAALLLAALDRFTARPLAIFRIVAAAALLLSLVPLLALPMSLGVALTLAAMHLIAAAVIVYVLTTQTRAA